MILHQYSVFYLHILPVLQLRIQVIRIFVFWRCFQNPFYRLFSTFKVAVFHVSFRQRPPLLNIVAAAGNAHFDSIKLFLQAFDRIFRAAVLANRAFSTCLNRNFPAADVARQQFLLHCCIPFFYSFSLPVAVIQSARFRLEAGALRLQAYSASVTSLCSAEES